MGIKHSWTSTDGSTIFDQAKMNSNHVIEDATIITQHLADNAVDDTKLDETKIYQMAALKSPLVYPVTDSATAIQFTKADGSTAILIIDTSNSRLGLVNAPTAALDLPASATGAASLRIRTGVAPSSPNEGDSWFDSTRKTLVAFMNGIKNTFSAILFTATANGTCGNTGAETSIVGTGVGTMTLPANYLVAGKTIRITVYGAYTTKASAPGTLVIKIKLGSTIICALPATTPTANLVKAPFVIDCIITCQTNGATGTVIGHGDLFLATSVAAQTGVSYTLPNQGSDPITAVANINTTGTLVVGVTATWGTSDVANIIVGTNVVLEGLN